MTPAHQNQPGHESGPDTTRARHTKGPLFGPFTRPVRRDPVAWVTAAVVVAATAGNALRAWSESGSFANAAVLGGFTLVLTTITTVFLASVFVGIPRGWRLGRQDRPPERPTS